MKLSEAIAAYVAVQNARRGESRTKGVRTGLRLFLRIVGDREIRNLTPEHVEGFLYGPGGVRDHHMIESSGVRRLAPPVNGGTHNRYRSQVAQFLSWCRLKGYVRRDDLMSLTSPLPVQREERQRPTPVTLLRLLDQARNPRDRALLATAANTGLRGSEITRLRIGDVDLEAGYLRVKITKTGDSDSQPITSDLDAELRTWLTIYTTDLGRPLAADDYLFPSQTPRPFNGGTETDENGVWTRSRVKAEWIPTQTLTAPHRVVQQALEALGLPTHKEGLHTVRRAVALAYFEAVSQEQGDVAALREVAALLHHQNLVTTERYLGLTAEKVRRDRRLKGQPFLTALVQADNVIALNPGTQAG